MLKLNLILNGLVSSLDHAIRECTCCSVSQERQRYKLRTFDYVVSSPPFKMDFSDTRERIAAMPVRFGLVFRKFRRRKKSMAIYTLFIQHVLNSLKAKGKVRLLYLPVCNSEIRCRKILQHIVDEHIVYGCNRMPSNLFANVSGTNVSVLFFDNSKETEKVVLMGSFKTWRGIQRRK